MAKALGTINPLPEGRDRGTEPESLDQGPTASKGHSGDSSSAASTPTWVLFTLPSAKAGTWRLASVPPARDGLAGEAARGSRSHHRTSVSRGPVAALRMAAPGPSPLAHPFASLSPLPAQGARTPVRRGPRSPHALSPGRGRAVTHLLGDLSLRGPGVGTAGVAGRGTGRGSPARLRSGGSPRLRLAGGEAQGRRGGGRKEAGLGPRRGRKF